MTRTLSENFQTSSLLQPNFVPGVLSNGRIVKSTSVFTTRVGTHRVDVVEVFCDPEKLRLRTKLGVDDVDDEVGCQEQGRHVLIRRGVVHLPPQFDQFDNPSQFDQFDNPSQSDQFATRWQKGCQTGQTLTTKFDVRRSTVTYSYGAEWYTCLGFVDEGGEKERETTGYEPFALHAPIQ